MGLPNLKITWQQTLNWQPSEQQIRQFEILYQQIIEGNQKLNLTRITEPEEFWEKHLWDSLAPFREINDLDVNWESELSVIDVGTGAGFPGLPVAIAYPHWSVTLLDSTRKKINFIEEIIPQLAILKTQVLVGRAEAIAKDKLHREHYDLVLIRAVGSATICAEYTLPLLKVGGMAILYRGHWTEEETQELATNIEKVGGEIAKITQLTTPLTKSIRHCIYLRKYKNNTYNNLILRKQK